LALAWWRRIPAIAAFVLLAWQVALPWTVPHFAAGDGPSHLYGATVARELVFHHHKSVYTPFYTIQRTALPNWTGTIVLALTGAIAGADHGEALFVSLAMLTGFLGLSYLIYALAPERSPWTPVSNFLIQTWFIRIGFYSFYLGMALLPFVIGYYIRHTGKLTWKRLALLSAGFVVLFFSHLIAVAIALAAAGFVFVWLRLFARPDGEAKQTSLIREAGLLLIAAAPSLILCALYLYGAPGGEIAASGPVWTLIRTFGQQIFLTANADQSFLRAGVLEYIIAGVVLMSTTEWRSARGGIAGAALLCFIAFLFMPAQGFGGSAVLIRFGWAVFLLGAMIPLTAGRLEIVRVPVAIAVGALVAVNTVATQRTMRSLSHAADPYLAAARRITPGSTLIRMSYPAPRAAAQYGFEGSVQFPFAHLDSLVAVEKHAINLTDYESLSLVFPIVNKGRYAGKEFQLWSLEGPGLETITTLDWLERVMPRPADYVFLFGDEQSAEAQQVLMPQMAAYLSAHMHLAATSSDGLLRVYARN
jgi:hypothetical protein